MNFIKIKPFNLFLLVIICNITGCVSQFSSYKVLDPVFGPTVLLQDNVDVGKSKGYVEFFILPVDIGLTGGKRIRKSEYSDVVKITKASIYEIKTSDKKDIRKHIVDIIDKDKFFSKPLNAKPVRLAYEPGKHLFQLDFPYPLYSAYKPVNYCAMFMPIEIKCDYITFVRIEIIEDESTKEPPVADAKFNFRYVVSAEVPVAKSDDAFVQLRKVLKSDKWSDRWSAIKSLEDSSDPKALDLLVESLKDEDVDVRIEAAMALMQRDDSKCRDSLLSVLFNHLKSNDPFVRINAAFILGEIGDKRANNALSECLNSEKSINRFKEACKGVSADFSGFHVKRFCKLALESIRKKNQ